MSAHLPVRRHRLLLILAVVVAAGAAIIGPLAWPGHVAHADTAVTFRLPAERGRSVVPDARDIAEPAPGDAPLLVFLPATGAVPAHYTRFLDTAHAAGFSVLGLDYSDTGPSLARSCAADMVCYGDMLANRFNGSDPTRFSRVGSTDGILDRLDDALAYLRTHDTAGQWQRYRTDAGVRWGRLVLAGHSQGGSEAAYIAHLHAVRGVLMFSAPAEGLDDRTAGWLSTRSATPASRMWALDDVHDLYAGRIAPSWNALGIAAGTPSRLPTGAHGLLTTLPLGNGGQAHGRVISDNTPLGGGGRPLLLPVWQWMLSRVSGHEQRS